MSTTDYLFRCLDIIKNDKNLSENTLIIMFEQYAKLKNEINCIDFIDWFLKHKIKNNNVNPKKVYEEYKVKK